MELYKLSEAYFELEDMDLTSEELLEKLESLDGEFDAKADSICHVLKNLEVQRDFLMTESTRLDERAAALINRYNGLKDYLRNNMEKLGKKKIESAKFTINCVAGRDKVGDIDYSKLPARFMYTPEVDEKLDKKMLLAELKMGDIEGAELVKSKSSLRIK